MNMLMQMLINGTVHLMSETEIIYRRKAGECESTSDIKGTVPSLLVAVEDVTIQILKHLPKELRVDMFKTYCEEVEKRLKEMEHERD